MDKGEAVSIYDQPIELHFEKPIEIKKGKTYLLNLKGGEMPGNAIDHILKHLKKTTGAKFIWIQGNATIKEI
jgi:hypothetical protein